MCRALVLVAVVGCYRPAPSEHDAATTCAGGGGGGGLGTIQYFHGVTCPAARCHPAAVTNP
jgi:hypothetical protein